MDLVPAKVLRCLLLLLCSGVGSLWPGQGWAQGESASMVLLGEAPLIEIEAVQKQMTMGDLLELNVKSNSESVKGCLLLPYVNGLRWGAHAVCTGPSTVLRIPMCEQGPQQVQVMVRAGMWDEQGAFVARSELSCLLAGSPAPKTAQGMWLSKPVTVEVIEPARQGLGGEPSRRVGVVWNPMVVMPTLEQLIQRPVPVQGYYQPFDLDTIRQQLLWMAQAGFDYVVMNWADQPGEDPGKLAGVQISGRHYAATLLYEARARLNEEGLAVPRVVMCYPVTGDGALTDQCLTWFEQNICTTERLAEGLQRHNGKPLVLLRGRADWAHPAPVKKHNTLTLHYWVDDENAMRTLAGQGQPVWGAPSAQVRDELSTMSLGICVWPLGREGEAQVNAASQWQQMHGLIENRPPYLLVSQWNGGSQNLEPTELDPPAGLGATGRGFQGINLMQAYLDMYRAGQSQQTYLVLISPTEGQVVRSGRLVVTWFTVGKPAEQYTVKLGSSPVAYGLKDLTCTLDLTGRRAGEYELTVVAEGTQARYRRATDGTSRRLARPVPASAQGRFTLAEF